MPLFLTVLEGPTPAEASPLIATGDARLIKAVIDELNDRFVEKTCASILPLPGRSKERKKDVAGVRLKEAP